MSRTRAIVAVFGSDDAKTLGVAESLGQALVEKGCVLLTGGGKLPDAETVKDRAMRGAAGAELAGHKAPRVGVLGKEATTPSFIRQGSTALVFLCLAYGDRRNYVEACMSDAVVAFQGGNGTRSEVAFALSLGRPVFLVGNQWQGEFPAVRSETAFNDFVERAKRRAHAEGDGAIDALISDAYAALSREAEHNVTFLPLGTDPQDLAESAQLAAKHAHWPGHFPPMPERTDLGKAYQEWLDQI